MVDVRVTKGPMAAGPKALSAFNQKNKYARLTSKTDQRQSKHDQALSSGQAAPDPNLGVPVVTNAHVTAMGGPGAHIRY